MCDENQEEKSRRLLPQPVPAIFDVPFDIQPKGNEQIDDNRRTKCYKRKVNEINTDPCGGYPHLVA